MRYFLLIININKINLYIVDIKIYIIYLKMHFIYSYLISYFDNFNILKKVLFIKKLIID